MKKTAITALILLILIAAGAAFYFFEGGKLKKDAAPLTDENGPALNDFYDQSSASSSPLSSSSTIATNIPATSDIRIDLQYEEPPYSHASLYTTSSDYTDPSTGEKFLLLSDKINTNGYGSKYYEIFQALESHSYQGTPIYLSKVNNNQSLSYIGLKVNDPSLISNLKVELGIDYFALPRSNSVGWLNNLWNKVLSWVSTKIVEACGPGIYLRLVGDSNMTYIGSKDGISWYKLDKEISVNNLPLNYCNGTDCYANPAVKDLTGGNLRMHIDYTPTGKSGSLKVQLANTVFHDQTNGSYSQATLGKDSSHMYRAVLSDEEVGSFSLTSTIDSPNLNLTLTNKGNAPITISNYSFNRIRNGVPGKQAVGFVIKDMNNVAISHISFDDIISKVSNQTIPINGQISVPIFSPVGIITGFYTLGVEYINSSIQSPTAPKLIYWGFDYPPISQGPLFALYIDSNASPIPIISLTREGWNYSNSSLPQINQQIYNLAYYLPANSYGVSYGSNFHQTANDINQYQSKGDTIATVKNNTGSLWMRFIPNISVNDLFTQLGVQPFTSFHDFEGNIVNIYNRGALTGYAIERTIRSFRGSDTVHGVLVYEIPTSYLNDTFFASFYHLAIKSTSQSVSSQ